MRVPKSKAAPEPANRITLKVIRQLLDELEDLGFVKRTGEFANGQPVYYTPTVAGKEACASPQQSMREKGVRLSRTGTRTKRLTNGEDHSA